MPSKKYLDESGLAYYDGTVEDRFNPLNAYPVGSIYMSVNSTSPATLFGGTWERIQDMFLLAAGTTYAAGATGGAATVTLTSAQSGVPAHSHGLNSHKHSVGAHAHGLNSHTHSLQSHTHTTTMGKHSHSVTTTAQRCTNIIKISDATLHWASYKDIAAGGDFTRWLGTGRDVYVDIPALSGTAADKDLGSKTSGGPSNNTSGGPSTTNTANSTAFDSGAATGDTANNTAADASSAHENMPPYLSVYVWKRTA